MTTLARALSHTQLLSHTHAHTFFSLKKTKKNTHPLLRCWWLRNCHNPFCIDAATVRAEPGTLNKKERKKEREKEEGEEEEEEKKERGETPNTLGERGK